jgi:PAS domain S-box-containing protein
MSSDKQAGADRRRRPLAFASAIALLALVVFGPVLWQEREARRDLDGVMESNGRSVLATLSAGIANAVRAHDEVLALIESGLRQQAAEIAAAAPQHLDEVTARVRAAHSPAVVAVWPGPGAEPRVWREEAGQSEAIPSPPEDLLAGKARERVYGFFEDPLPARPVFGIARRGDDGRIVYVGASADSLLQLRKIFGVGRLVQEFARKPGVSHVLIQDDLGLIAASGDVDEVLPLEEDPQVAAAWSEGTFSTRRLLGPEGGILEFVAPYGTGSEAAAVLRLGVSAAPLERLQARFRLRIMLSGALFLSGVIVAFAMTRQVTALRRTRALHRASEVRTDSILASIADGVLVLDEGGRIVVANPAVENLLGFDARRWVGKPLAQVPSLGELAAAMSTAGPLATKEWTTRSGRHLRLLASMLDQADLPGPAMVIVVRDETDARRLQEAQRRAEQWTVLSQMAATAAHEIRNPLNALSMFVQRLVRKCRSVPEVNDVVEDADRVRSEIARIDRIVANFLRVARPPRVRPEPADVGALLHDLAAGFAPDVEQEGKRFELRVPRSLPGRCDRQLLGEAVTNLLKNAQQAAPSGGRVCLSALSEGGALRIVVEDDGPGVAAQDRERIFDLYFTTKADGSGLGLPLAHHIVRSHGGTLEVAESELGGARFEIVLPQGREMT